ncbi:MAG: PadR family transcriptional regulator [Candidatus Hodarchaeales archaeon]
MRTNEQNQIIDFKSFLGRSLLSLLILCVINLEGPCTGYSIIKKIRKMTNGTLMLKAGTVYPVLESLKEDNLIIKESQKAENRTKNGFRIRSVYKLTNTGLEILKKEWEKWEQLQNILVVFTPIKKRVE